MLDFEWHQTWGWEGKWWRFVSCESVENWLVLTRLSAFQANKYNHPSLSDRMFQRHTHTYSHWTFFKVHRLNHSALYTLFHIGLSYQMNIQNENRYKNVPVSFDLRYHRMLIYKYKRTEKRLTENRISQNKKNGTQNEAEKKTDRIQTIICCIWTIERWIWILNVLVWHNSKQTETFLLQPLHTFLSYSAHGHV